jgi:hypothetical protein
LRKILPEEKGEEKFREIVFQVTLPRSPREPTAEEFRVRLMSTDLVNFPSSKAHSFLLSILDG